MITIKQHNQIVSAVKRYGKALVADSWKGGGDPADIPEIEAKLKLSEAHLNKLLSQLTEK